MEVVLEWWMQAGIAILTYLLGMAFAGSFLGRKWMGTVDIFLHKLFKREITVGKYLYWKHFCNINNAPKPASMMYPQGFKDILVTKFLS
jgi:hypothetical protein